MSQNYSSNRNCATNIVGFSFPSLLLTFAITLCLSGLAFAISDIHEFENLHAQQLAFTENQGQWPDSILYRGIGGGATMWFTKDGVYYQFSRAKQKANENPSAMEGRRLVADLETITMKVAFAGTNTDVKPVGEAAMDYKCNFFLGNDSTRWRTDVANYESIIYNNIYDGIDLKYYVDGEQLKCNFVVSPGADISQIQLQFASARSVTVSSSGQLLVESLWGNLPEQAPIIYQERDGKKQMINSVYELNGANFAAINLTQDYDASQATYINPTPSFSTFLGGAATDRALDIAVNSSGQAVICGWTTSSDFPTISAWDNSLSVGIDAFMTRFNASGTGLVHSTYFGNNGTDVASSVALYGDLPYLAGYTSSTDFFAFGLDTSHNGLHDCFLTVFSSTGGGISFSTYLGGSGDDIPFDMALRCPSPCAAGVKVYIVGTTDSPNFPTPNAFDASYNGSTDAFMARITVSATNTLDFGTFLGGSDYDAAYAVDLSGFTESTLKPHIAGETTSRNFPTANAYDDTLTGVVDAFITSFGVAGNGSLFLSNSTFFGGSELSDPTGRDAAYSIFVRSSGNICIAGVTSSSTLGTPGAFDPTYNTGGDAFIAEFNSSVASLAYFTYLGGSQLDYPGIECLRAEAVGGLYLGGTTQSADFPLANAFDASLGGTDDAFIANLRGDGSALFFSTYLGGTSGDFGDGFAIDAFGCTYSCGYTNSSSFPILNPYDGSLGGTEDAYLTKICIPRIICGDADGSGIVTISDAVYLINYIFAGGTPPDPLLTGDVDCNGLVTISDAVYLINYIFAGGAAPCAACN